MGGQGSWGRAKGFPWGQRPCHRIPCWAPSWEGAGPLGPRSGDVTALIRISPGHVSQALPGRAVGCHGWDLSAGSGWTCTRQHRGGMSPASPGTFGASTHPQPGPGAAPPVSPLPPKPCRPPRPQTCPALLSPQDSLNNNGSYPPPAHRTTWQDALLHSSSSSSSSHTGEHRTVGQGPAGVSQNLVLQWGCPRPRSPSAKAKGVFGPLCWKPLRHVQSGHPALCAELGSLGVLGRRVLTPWGWGAGTGGYGYGHTSAPPPHPEVREGPAAWRGADLGALLLPRRTLVSPRLHSRRTLPGKPEGAGAEPRGDRAGPHPAAAFPL